MKGIALKLLGIAVLSFLFLQCGTKEEAATIAQNSPPKLAHHPIPEWFEQEKFGIFVHYGVMGTFGHFNNQLKEKKSWLPQEVFEKAGAEFTLHDDTVFHWAENFKKWGARYAVLTTSQHPGFALWDSEVTDRTIPQLSPYKRDLVDTWAKALRKNDIRVGLYFNHEDKGDKELMQILAKDPDNKFDEPYWQSYLDKRDAKVEELVSNYGPIDLLWFDADWIAKSPEELGTKKLVDMIVKHQPEVVLNNRLRSAHHGHYGTPEKYIPIKDRDGPWETCDNLRNNSLWGYVYDPAKGNDYRTAKEIIYTLKEVICSGGNYLLNIGPHPNGQIIPRELEIMDSVGVFVNQFEQAIFNTTQGLPRACFGEGSTYKDGKLYLFTQQNGGEIFIKGLMNTVLAVNDLKTGAPLSYHLFGGRRKHGSPEVIKIAVPKNDTGIPNVIEVSIEGDLKIQRK